MEHTAIPDSMIKHVLAEFEVCISKSGDTLYTKVPPAVMNDNLRAFIKRHKHRILTWACEAPAPSSTRQHQAPNK